jgi:hypothetical protein
MTRADAAHSDRKLSRRGQPLDLFHADLCGQIHPKTPGAKNYLWLIVDDHSRFMWGGVAGKDEAFKCFKRVKAFAETEHGGRLRAFHSNRGVSSTHSAPT